MVTQLSWKKTSIWRRAGARVTGDLERSAQRAQIARRESWHFLASALSPWRSRGPRGGGGRGGGGESAG